jgi:hypothetical protein
LALLARLVVELQRYQVEASAITGKAARGFGHDSAVRFTKLNIYSFTHQFKTSCFCSRNVSFSCISFRLETIDASVMSERMHGMAHVLHILDLQTAEGGKNGR